MYQRDFATVVALAPTGIVETNQPTSHRRRMTSPMPPLSFKWRESMSDCTIEGNMPCSETACDSCACASQFPASVFDSPC